MRLIQGKWERKRLENPTVIILPLPKFYLNKKSERKQVKGKEHLHHQLNHQPCAPDPKTPHKQPLKEKRYTFNQDTQNMIKGRSKEVEQTPSEVVSSLDTPAQRTRSRGRSKEAEQTPSEVDSSVDTPAHVPTSKALGAIL